MKKLLAAALSLVILGAGCTSSPTTQNPGNNNLTNGPASYSLAEVQTANSEQNCWTAINGRVYNLTSYMLKHPGGKQELLRLCGKDGTALFSEQHGGAGKPEQMLKTLEIGILK